MRIVAADIKDIPPLPPLLLTNERDRSLLQLRQSHLLISAALIIHYPRPPTLRTNLDPTFANPCYKSFHSPPRFRFRCYVVTDYMREGINSEIDSSFSVVFYSFKKKNLLGWKNWGIIIGDNWERIEKISRILVKICIIFVLYNGMMILIKGEGFNVYVYWNNIVEKIGEKTLWKLL